MVVLQCSSDIAASITPTTLHYGWFTGYFRLCLQALRLASIGRSCRPGSIDVSHSVGLGGRKWKNTGYKGRRIRARSTGKNKSSRIKRSGITRGCFRLRLCELSVVLIDEF